MLLCSNLNHVPHILSFAIILEEMEGQTEAAASVEHYNHHHKI